MFYVIPDTWLKVALNTNKTGQHVIHYTGHIVESRKTPIKLANMFYTITNMVESGVKHQ